jgi:hypothetical protein
VVKSQRKAACHPPSCFCPEHNKRGVKREREDKHINMTVTKIQCGVFERYSGMLEAATKIQCVVRRGQLQKCAASNRQLHKYSV